MDDPMGKTTTAFNDHPTNDTMMTMSTLDLAAFPNDWTMMTMMSTSDKLSGIGKQRRAFPLIEVTNTNTNTNMLCSVIYGLLEKNSVPAKKSRKR